MTTWSELCSHEHRLHFRYAGPVRTRSLEAGPQDSREAVLFLHGTGGHLEAYTRNLSPHAAAGHRTIAIDMLGHGYTDKPDRPYEIDAYVQHVRDFCDAAGIDRVCLSGESLGGWVAARFACIYPERLSRLVLNTAGGLTANPAVMERLKTLTRRAVREASRETVRARLEFLMKDPASVTEDLIDVRYQIYTQPGFSQALEHILCLQEMPVRERNMLEPSLLAQIRVPTLVVWTTHDPTAPVAVGEQFARAIPGARLVVLKDCGHWPQFEDPETFNRVHLEFLAEDVRATRPRP